MSYRTTVPILLPVSDTGLDLEIQLQDDDGDDVGDPITTGFWEIGGGAYGWTGDLPDDHRGVGVVREQGDPTVRAAFAINPEEIELQTATYDAVTALAQIPVGSSGGSGSGWLL